MSSKQIGIQIGMRIYVGAESLFGTTPKPPFTFVHLRFVAFNATLLPLCVFGCDEEFRSIEANGNTLHWPEGASTSLRPTAFTGKSRIPLRFAVLAVGI
ncbi:hypothetical protein RJT34_04448 [Clitoria ternatea]|uniref:Uncharacterized protein n=1 Tax=Clitoria ternatea TaxID=43366 RepID=A0AAN9KP41_CLITE